MSVIHKKCNALVISSGRGDFGVCTKCGEDVHHLIVNKFGQVGFSDEVLMTEE